MARGRSRAGWRRRKALLDAHIKRFGFWCPGDESHGPHPAARLEVDHVVPVVLGGRDGDGMRVLCARCNRSRGAKLGNQLRTAMRIRHSRVW